MPLDDHSTSNHPVGVNVGTIDGSVCFIRYGGNAGSCAALETVAGGEIVGADSS